MNDGTAWQTPFKAGDRLLKFDIRGVIGQGGQAIVYEGWDDFLKRRVAIKVVTDPAPDLARRAQAEAQVLCDLHHPNIVHVIDAGLLDDRMIYIVMELLVGRTLREVLWQVQRLSVVEALTIGAQIADGVQVAHCLAEPVIHRDLKPENVFIVPGNSPKVLDFGIAKFVARKDMTTQRNVRRGTVGYMSPEQLQGLEVTPSTDVYALGTILYEAISGFRPCEIGKAEPTPESSMWHQLSIMPPQLDRFVPGVSKQVGRLIQRMLAKDPEGRFGNMAEVSEILRAECLRIVAGADPSYQGRRLWDVTAFPPPARRLADPFNAQTALAAMVLTNQTTTPAAPPAAAPASNTPPGPASIAQPENARQPMAVPRSAPAQPNHVMLPTVEQRLAAPSHGASRASAEQVVAAAQRWLENDDLEPRSARPITAPKGRATPATRPVTVASSTAVAPVQPGGFRFPTAALALGAGALAFGLATYSVRLFNKTIAKPAELTRVTSAAPQPPASARPASIATPSTLPEVPSIPAPESEPSPSAAATKPNPSTTPRAPRHISAKATDDEPWVSRNAWFPADVEDEPHSAKPKASSTPKGAAAPASSARGPQPTISPEPGPKTKRPRLWLQPR